ncbi:MAG: SH3 domain-containing protein [Hyphomonadaceae bacterium]|nr:SH3 domain-containing protein [Hyphomonadaceae bacterium]
MPRSRALPILVSLLLLGGPAAAAPRTGSDSRLPVPRYESLAAAEVYGRRGPGQDHRIDWVYRARGLPVRVLEEAGPWRKVKDPAGDEAWIHARNLSPNRTVLVAGGAGGRLAVRTAPRPEARLVAYAERGVIAALKECLGGWRRIEVGDRAAGWVAAEDVWAGEDCTLPE